MNHFTGNATVLNQVVTTTGALLGAPADGPYPGVFCTVYQHNSTVLATIYGASLALLPNPFPVGVEGAFDFYGPDSSYDLVFSTTAPADRLIPAVQVPAYGSTAALPAVDQQLPGRLARVSSGLFMAIGEEWVPIGNAKLYSITDYGAVGDGVTHCAAAIQAAIDAVWAAGGGAVYVPRGIFLIDAPVLLRDNVSLVGDGPGHILKAKSGLNDSWLGGAANNISVRRLELDGNKANNTVGGVIVMNGKRITVADCYIHDCPTTGVQFGVPSNGDITNANDGFYNVLNNRFYNCGMNGYGAIAITHGRDIFIANNQCIADDGLQTYGIDLEPNAGNSIYRATITNNVINQGRIFIDLEAQGSAVDNNIVVTNNVVDARSSGADYGLFDNICPLYIRNAHGIKVTGNTLLGHADGVRGGIYVGSPISRFQFTDNLIFPQQPPSLNGYGIAFNFQDAVATDGVVANNYIIGVDGPNTDYGIHCFHPTGMVRVEFRDNTFHRITTPYEVARTTGDCQISQARVLKKAVSYVMTYEDGDNVVVLADASGGAITITPYSAGGLRGRQITVIKVDSSLNPVTIDPTGSETWSGVSTLMLMRQWQRSAAVSNDTNWIETIRYRELVLNVFDYGVRGDGATDDTTAFQAALDAAKNSAGVLYMPPGTYILGRCFVGAGTTLRGCGSATVLKQKNGANSMILDIVDSAVYYDDVRIENLTIDGNKANNTSRGGISILGRRCVVQNVTVKNAYLGIAFGGFNSGSSVPDAGASQIVDNVLENCVVGVQVVHGTDITIGHNVIRNTDGDATVAINVTANSANTIDSILISGNNIWNGGNIVIDCHTIAKGTSIAVVGNFVRRSGSADGDAPLYLSTLFEVQVSGNAFYGLGTMGVRGIYVAGPIEQFLIDGNAIFGPTVTGTYYGIKFANSASVAVDGVLSNNLIAGGTIATGIYSPHASGWSNVDASGNRFRNVTTHHDVATAGIAIGPSRVFTQLRTWDPPSINDGAMASTTLTFSGAATGDYVTATMDSLPAGWIVFASVTAADTVTITLFNKTGGTVNLGSTNVRMVLYKFANAGIY